MGTIGRVGTTAFAAVCFACAQLAAPTNAQTPAPRPDPPLIVFGLGYFDALRRHDPAAEARIEYRFDRQFLLFKPFVGAMATSDGALLGFAGVLVDIALTDRFVLTPSFAPGLFSDGGGRDLGHVVEFRSQIELSYRFDNQSRLGLSVNHISNASLADRNPGVETIALTYAVPIGCLYDR